MTALHEQHAAEVQTKVAQLDADATWKQLDVDVQQEILLGSGMGPPDSLDIATDSRLLTSLAGRNLSAWKDAIDAVGSRAAQALAKAAERVSQAQPDAVVATTVSVQKGTLADADAVDTWIETHRAKLKEAVANGPVIVQ